MTTMVKILSSSIRKDSTSNKNGNSKKLQLLITSAKTFLKKTLSKLVHLCLSLLSLL